MTFDPKLFAFVFWVVFLSELPDKTAAATVMLAARRHPVAVYIGVAAAFLVQTVVAVAFGGALNLLPPDAVRVGSALLFFAFAVWMWWRREEDASPHAPGGAAGFARTLWIAFLAIFVAEWGDLSQLTTAALAAKHGSPLTVLAAATLSLWSVTLIAVVVGSRLRSRLHPRLLQKAAAVVLAFVGLLCLAR